jgi:hypothetical protein
MIHGTHDMVPASPRYGFVPRAEVATLECGHWISRNNPRRPMH